MITRAIVGVTALVLVVLSASRWPSSPTASIIDAELPRSPDRCSAHPGRDQRPARCRRLGRRAVERDPPPAVRRLRHRRNRGLFGDGPAEADGPVSGALDGGGDRRRRRRGRRPSSSTPIVEPGTERVLGALARVTVARRRRRPCASGVALMVIAAVAGSGDRWWHGWWARRVAERLSRPIERLARSAARHPLTVRCRSITADRYRRDRPAGGDVVQHVSPSSTRRSARERQFSSDVSHQLRTPLTGLRLRLEAAAASGSRVDIDAAIGDLDRIDRTVEHLLRHARDEMAVTSTVDLAAAGARAVERWAGTAKTARRTLQFVDDGSLEARGCGHRRRPGPRRPRPEHARPRRRSDHDHGTRDRRRRHDRRRRSRLQRCRQRSARVPPRTGPGPRHRSGARPFADRGRRRPTPADIVGPDGLLPRSARRRGTIYLPLNER